MAPWSHCISSVLFMTRLLQNEEKYILGLLMHFPHLLYLTDPELNLHKVFSGFYRGAVT